MATGTASAVAGGFTAVACMPNTEPDQRSGEHHAVHPQEERRGQSRPRLSDWCGLGRVARRAARRDGRSSRRRMRRRVRRRPAGAHARCSCGGRSSTRRCWGMPVIDHCEDPSLKGDGVAHEGYHASRLGLPGIPGEAEELMVERDVTIAGMTHGRVHIAHLSTRGSLRAVRAGKDRGVRGDLRGDAPSFRAHRRGAGRVRHQHQDESAAARGRRSRRARRRAGRRQRRRHCHRSRAASLRREARRVRSGAVRHRRARDLRAAHIRSARPHRADHGCRA